MLGARVDKTEETEMRATERLVIRLESLYSQQENSEPASCWDKLRDGWWPEEKEHSCHSSLPSQTTTLSSCEWREFQAAGPQSRGEAQWGRHSSLIATRPCLGVPLLPWACVREGVGPGQLWLAKSLVNQISSLPFKHLLSMWQGQDQEGPACRPCPSGLPP